MHVLCCTCCAVMFSVFVKLDSALTVRRTDLGGWLGRNVTILPYSNWSSLLQFPYRYIPADYGPRSERCGSRCVCVRAGRSAAAAPLLVARGPGRPTELVVNLACCKGHRMLQRPPHAAKGCSIIEKRPVRPHWAVVVVCRITGRSCRAIKKAAHARFLAEASQIRL